MTIFNWIKTNISAAIASGIRDGVAEGLGSVTGGEIVAVDGDAKRIEVQPQVVAAAESVKRKPKPGRAK